MTNDVVPSPRLPAPAAKDRDCEPFLAKADDVRVHRDVPQKPIDVARIVEEMRALGPVLDWAELHRSELLESWRRAQRHLDLSNIEPLE